MKWVIKKVFNLCSGSNKEKKKQQQNLHHHGHMKGHEEILVTIPGAVVNLVGQEKSQELAKGQFSLVKLVQEDKAIAVYAKVGGDLCWPVTKDAPTLKLDSGHYLFSIHTPPAAEEAGDSAKYGGSEVLNFGVTFGGEESVGILDQCLKQNACLSLPSGSCSWCSCLPNWSAAPPKPVKHSGDSEAYWTALAPNVEEYNSVLAKAIAGGSGQIIKGIFVLSDGYSSQVRKGGELLRSRSKADERPSAEKKKRSPEISPRVKKNIRRVRKLSKMTENMSNIIVDGVSVTPSDVMDSHTKCSCNCFTMLPAGDVALASLDAYNKVLEATHVAGKDATKTTSEVTTGVIADRYGEDAAEVAKDTLAITGHAIGTAVNVAKVTNPGFMLS